MRKIITCFVIVLTPLLLSASTINTTPSPNEEMVLKPSVIKQKPEKIIGKHQTKLSEITKERNNTIIDFINWLNKNTGFVMTVLTGVYVIATILILRESRRTNNLQNDAIKQSAAFENARNRPYVVFEIQPERVTHSEYDSELYYYAIVKNLGRTSAHNILIKTTPELLAMQGFGQNKEKQYRTPAILRNAISVLIPEGSTRDYVGPARFFFEEYSDDELRYEVSIIYSDINNKIYKENFTIDLASQKERTELEDINGKKRYQLLSTVESGAKSIEELVRVLDSPDRSNLFIPIDPSSLDTPQIELLNRLIDSIDNGSTTLFIVQRLIGGTEIHKLSNEKSVKIEGSEADAEYLCRAGALSGYYQNGTLQFTIAPVAGAILKSWRKKQE